MSTRAQQFEILAAGVIKDGATIVNPYAVFYVAGTMTAKNAYADVNKDVSITKKALDAQGRASVYGDGIYKIRIYSGDPDAGGVFTDIEIDYYKVTAVNGNTRTVSVSTTGSVDDSLIKADTTAGNVTYTLPDAALMGGKIIQTVKIVAGNVFTIVPASGQTINGEASISFSAIYSSSVFQSDGSNWFSYVSTNADTLDTYHASTTAVAGTIPVYNGSEALVGNITGNAATATNVAYSGLTGSVPTWNQNTTGNAATATKHGTLNVSVIEIGDWDMDATATKDVAHGLDYTKIRSVSVLIRQDSGAVIPLDSYGYSSTGAVNTTLGRTEAGGFDNTGFDSTSYNRGWITIYYID